MKKITSAIIICFLLAFSCCSVNANELPAVEWNRTYGARSGFVVFPDDDGGYVIGGTTGDWTYASGGDWVNSTFLFIKIDAAGEVVWEKNYTRGFFNSAILTSDGCYVLARTEEADLLKIDSQGNMKWGKKYDVLNEAFVWSVIQTSDGGFAIVGNGYFTVSGDDGMLVKIDSEGNFQWNKTYGDPNAYGTLRSVMETDDGYALAGSVGEDLWLVKTDFDGNVEWEKRYGGQKDDGCISALRTADGGYLLAGYTFSFGAGYEDCFAVKTDSQGNMEWNQTFGTSGRERCSSVAQTKNGGYVLSGDNLVVKVSALGELEWEKSLGDNTPQSVIVTSDGGYLLVGYKGGDYGSPDIEIWAVKLEPDYAHSAVDVLAWFFSADGITVTVAIVASCVTVIAVGLFIYKRRQTNNKT